MPEGTSEHSLRRRPEGLIEEYAKLPRAIHLLCLGSLINRIGSFVMLFLAIYISEELGYGDEIAGYCLGISGVGSVLATLAGGQLADQFGRRLLLLISLCGGAFLLVILSQVQAPWLFMVTLFSFSLVAEMYRPASAAVVADVTEESVRPAAFSLMFLSFNLGFALAPPIGGWLISFSWDWLFGIDALSTFLFGLVIYAWIPETRPAGPAAEPGQSREQAGAGFRGEWKFILSDFNFLLFWCYCLLSNLVFMQAFITLPLYLRKMGFSEQEIGRVLCLNGVLIVLLQLPLTRWVKGVAWLPVLLLGQVLMAVGFGMTVWAEQLPILIVSIVLWTLGEILHAPLKPELVMRMAPDNMRARYMGLFQMSYSVSIAVGAPLGGLVLSRFGGNGLWGGSSILLLLAGGSLFPLHRRLQQRNAEDSTTAAG